MEAILQKEKHEGRLQDVPNTVLSPPLGLDGKWGTDEDAGEWLRDYKPLLILTLEALLAGKAQKGLKSTDWRIRTGACWELLEWVKNPVTYSGAMMILGVASFVSAEQDWSQARSSYWQLGSGFRWAEVTSCPSWSFSLSLQSAKRTWRISLKSG